MRTAPKLPAPARFAAAAASRPTGEPSQEAAETAPWQHFDALEWVSEKLRALHRDHSSMTQASFEMNMADLQSLLANLAQLDIAEPVLHTGETHDSAMVRLAHQQMAGQARCPCVCLITSVQVEYLLTCPLLVHAAICKFRAYHYAPID